MPFPYREQDLSPVALIFATRGSQPNPLEWEICHKFPAIHRIHRGKKTPKTKTPLWSLKTPLSKAKWLRLHDSYRGLRIGAVKGCVAEVMHQKGSSLTPCLIPVQSSASCLLRECMWPTVCRLLVFLRAPGLLCPLCIKAKLHFLWWLALWLCMQLKWLFAPEVAVCIWEGLPTPCSDPFCPAFRLFQRIWREVRCPERSDGQGEFLQTAMTSVSAGISLVRSALLSSLFLDTSPV